MVIRRTRRIRTTEAAPEPQKKSPSPPKQKIVPIAPSKEDDDSAPKVDYAAVVKRYAEKVTNRKSAIRAKCVECCCGVLSEVRNCTVTKCALFPFREGNDPFNKKTARRMASEDNEE